ncbi:MAG: T9SS type A sorting domain-containing protein, partial [Ignavibacteria bacterium]|nr:T9SS type A sorting domain-containing protein [Ignavibacteria bacterium]
LTAGAYLLRLVLCDNTADSNQLEAVKQIQLNPIIVAIDENRPGMSGARITVLHSDLNKEIVFTLPRGIPAAVSMFDISGRQVRVVNSRVTGTGSMKINIRDLSAGVYFYTIKAGARKSAGTFIITN